MKKSVSLKDGLEEQGKQGEEEVVHEEEQGKQGEVVDVHKEGLFQTEHDFFGE